MMSATNDKSKSDSELESVDHETEVESNFEDDVRFYSVSTCQTIKRLSVSQLVMGVLSIFCNIALIIVWQYERETSVALYRYAGSGIWGGLFILITGILGIRATTLQTLGRVAACLVLNIICTLFSMTILGLALAGVTIHGLGPYKEYVGTFVAELVLMTSAVSQFCITIAISVLSCKTISHRLKKADINHSQASDGATSSIHTLPPKFNITTQVATKAKLSEDTAAKVKLCEIDGQLLDIGSEIGIGYFGSVHRGTYTTAEGRVQTVAVKTLKGESLDISQIEQFLEEGTLMMQLRHANILSLVGVVYEVDSLPMVVLPFMNNGDLKSLIQRDDIDIVVGDLLHFGLQISHGMAYLYTQRFVHRDLAARNCMVDSSLIIKIGDFGMSRDVYSKDYYVMDDRKKPLPLKGMAPESMTEGRFNSSTDMWSFGVLMWELFTHGCTPYPAVNNYDLMDYILSDKRLHRPQCCPPIVFEMMLQCWSIEPEERPSFTQWSEYLDNLLSDNQPRVATKEITNEYYADCV